MSSIPSHPNLNNFLLSFLPQGCPIEVNFMYAPIIPLLLPSLSNSTLSLIRSLWLLFSLNICECNFVLTTPKGGSSRSKTVSKGSMPQGSKRKVVGLVEDPIDEDIPATGSDIGVPPSQLANPISSHPPRAPAPKRIHLGAACQAKPISFVPPAVKAMSSSHACTSSSSSPRVLILNDSFHMMLDYKAKHNKFPSTYDDMVAFLSEVHIQLNSNSMQLACPYSLFFVLNALVFFTLGWSIQGILLLRQGVAQACSGPHYCRVSRWFACSRSF